MYDVKKSDAKAQVQSLHNMSDGQKLRAWGYVCDNHAIDQCFMPGFFSSLRSNFQAGDTIRLSREIKGNCVASCNAVVIQVTDKDVDVRMESEHITYWSDRDDFKEEKIKIKEEPPPAYIKGEGRIKWNIGKEMFDIIVDNQVVAEVRDRDTAERIVRGDMPMPPLKIRGLADDDIENPSFSETDSGPTIENEKKLEAASPR